MPAHIHAELMAQYAQDATETDKPWERWQIYIHADEYGDDRWSNLSAHPKWGERLKYRRKPRTININGYEMPEPIHAEPTIGELYYAVRVENDDPVGGHEWRGDEFDILWLNRGLCHSTKEAAIAHAKALLSFTAKPEAGDE